jgi:hypothetical protein
MGRVLAALVAWLMRETVLSVKVPSVSEVSG